MDPATHPEHLKMLEDWLKSYRPEELFDEKGRLMPELADLAPEGARRMGAKHRINDVDGSLVAVENAMPPGEQVAAPALALRISLAKLWDQLMDFQEATVSTSGELGTITNLELHIRLHHSGRRRREVGGHLVYTFT